MNNQHPHTLDTIYVCIHCASAGIVDVTTGNRWADNSVKVEIPGLLTRSILIEASACVADTFWIIPSLKISIEDSSSTDAGDQQALFDLNNVEHLCECSPGLFLWEHHLPWEPISKTVGKASFRIADGAIMREKGMEDQ